MKHDGPSQLAPFLTDPSTGTLLDEGRIQRTEFAQLGDANEESYWSTDLRAGPTGPGKEREAWHAIQRAHHCGAGNNTTATRRAKPTATQPPFLLYNLLELQIPSQ